MVALMACGPERGRARAGRARALRVRRRRWRVSAKGWLSVTLMRLEHPVADGEAVIEDGQGGTVGSTRDPLHHRTHGASRTATRRTLNLSGSPNRLSLFIRVRWL